MVNKKKKKIKDYSLTFQDWLNYLTTETSRERYDYYNEEVSNLLLLEPNASALLLATNTTAKDNRQKNKNPKKTH